ncbi:DMT family transporter [Nitratidesulfovibrio vulgaris]|uniref:DMT family transporter n=1 Tax=Nitratidesulfovibrio vulgaris TaxID=881 RepID=UPI0013E0DCD4|nr:DMT family transporter [Nitratidesulfovibrio vulgaris]
MERDTVLTATPTINADLADATSCATPSRTAVSPLLPVLAALAAVVLWGGAFPAMKVAVQTLGTWQMMWARMVFALLLLVPLARRLAPARIERRDLPLLAGMALMQPCLYFLCESTALQLTTSSQAGVMAASMPLMMAVGGFLLGEKVSPRLWFGVGVSCIGVAWLTSSGGEGGGSAPDPFTGNLLELAAMACATGSSLCIGALISRGKGRWNALTLTGIQTLAGAVFFLPGAPGVIGGVADWSTEVLLAVVYLGGASSLGAFGLYNWALGHMPASRAGNFINLVPVAAIFFGWLLLGETLTTTQYLATGLVMGGVLMGTRAR